MSLPVRSTSHRKAHLAAVQDRHVHRMAIRLPDPRLNLAESPEWILSDTGTIARSMSLSVRMDVRTGPYRFAPAIPGTVDTTGTKASAA